MFCNKNESVVNFRCKSVAIQLQFTYQTFISILLQLCYCFAIDLSIAKFSLQIRIFLVVNKYFCLEIIFVHGLGMCEGVGEDSRHEIEYVDIRV